MNEDWNNLEEVFRTANSRRTAGELPATWTDVVMRSIRTLPERDDSALWVWGAVCTSSIAIAALLLAVTGDLWDAGAGVAWFNDPVGLLSAAFFGA